MKPQDLQPGVTKLTFDATSYYGEGRESVQHTFMDMHDGSLGHKIIVTKEGPNQDGINACWYKEFQ